MPVLRGRAGVLGLVDTIWIVQYSILGFSSRGGIVESTVIELQNQYQVAYQEAYGRAPVQPPIEWCEEQYESAIDQLSWIRFLDRNDSQ